MGGAVPERTLVNNRYELEVLPLAKGGMGEVFMGQDKELEREVAVKLIRFSQDIPDQEAIRRFVRESRITARLQHPGIPAVYDVGTHEGWPYLVMQRINGITVADLIAENGPLPIGWAAAIAAQVCATLVAAHQATLIHRDLKPSNLMLEADGTVKVLDFGLAVAFDLANFSKITSTGQSVGTPAYMAPEQVNAATSSPQTDLYALGCTLHEMLTGRPLFDGSTAFAVMTKQVEQRPRPARELRFDIPAGLEQLLLELLEKEANNRPISADIVYRRLLPFVTELGALPGILNPASTASPVRMYAGVLSRIFATLPDTRQATWHSPYGPTSPLVTTTVGGPLWYGQSQTPHVLGQVQQPFGHGGQSPHVPGPQWSPPPAVPGFPASTPPHPAFGVGWRLRQSLWLLLPVLGFGCLGGIGLVYVGLRARRPAWWIPGIVYTLAGWFGFALVGVSGRESAASNWGVGIWLGVGIAGVLHAALINTTWLRWRAGHRPWYAQQMTAYSSMDGADPSPTAAAPAFNVH